jgi:uncharacterized protein YndB with AHSA1/START domain/predicted enzyme related to lactoylglutathione lyase
MQLRGLRTAQIRLDDVGPARDWYSRLFEIGPYFDEPFYVGFEIAGYEFGIFPDEGGRDEPLFLWATEDPTTYIERAVELGATVGMEPQNTGDGIVVGSFIDPFGNEFGLIRNPHFAPHLVATGATDLAEDVIRRRAEVPAAPDEAYALWATSDGLARWWTEHTVVELRPGGKYEIHFMPDERAGDRGGDWCRVLSFLPARMLSFTWNAPPMLKTRPEHTWVVLTFDPTPTGTSVELSHLGWPESGLADEASDWPATYRYFEEAWTTVMDRYQRHFDKG